MEVGEEFGFKGGWVVMVRREKWQQKGALGLPSFFCTLRHPFLHGWVSAVDKS